MTARRKIRKLLLMVRKHRTPRDRITLLNYAGYIRRNQLI